ncbi:hypothetical protein [Hippea maritima]|uniref:Uncharacterized protein n=1 Tax=Hippea maritima (strain ATCC 700847 / DSM 10411 / MH2) TaxID=760142 RepID=F2LY78_HIPMA|nr:hypothetical protein [Hippea maritima]AEA34401.1 hypothetical protein Hipma_1445 [Hippea maritima DSM 10411]
MKILSLVFRVIFWLSFALMGAGFVFGFSFFKAGMLALILSPVLICLFAFWWFLFKEKDPLGALTSFALFLILFLNLVFN